MKGQIAIMGPSGDERITWDTERGEEVAKARTRFSELVLQGYTAFNVGVRGEKSHRMSSFDPDIGQIIMVPPVRGG